MWVLVVILLVSLQSQVLVISQNPTCNSDDLRGLSGFMNGLESSINGWWPTTSSSILSSNCCDWVGITCNSSSNRIVRLELPNKRLTGSFSDSISNLDHLLILNLSQNFLQGPLPISLFRLAHLEVLDISSNEFNGVLPVNINLPALKILDLSDNAFRGSIPPLLSSHLVRLDLSANRLSGNIPDFFHRFPNLSYFSVHSNSLIGEIPPSLSNSHSVSSLNLRNISLNGSINFNCSVMVNLTSLDLGSNSFSGSIPATLPSCQKLKAINFARNHKLIGEVPETFENFNSLSYLSLSNCSFSNLASSLKILQHCPNLTILVLTMNFYNEQLPPNDNLQFKALKALVIPNCRLTGSIPPWLNSLSQLQLLDLSWNHLTGSIPAYFGDFKFLFYLDLSNNSLSGEIPKNLTRLETLISRDILIEESMDIENFIYRNMNISRGVTTYQYKKITNFPPIFDLSSNHLTGPIWPEFGNLEKIIILDLKHNNLSGTIPGSLSGMKSIEQLDFSFNSLTGTIPCCVPATLLKTLLLTKESLGWHHLLPTLR